jgi:hypothetical protein
MSEPKIIIEEFNGNCHVHVHDEQGLQIISEIIEEDPYAFISKLRSAMDGQIYERKWNDGTPLDSPIGLGDSVTDNVKRLAKQVDDLNRGIAALLEHINTIEESENSFTNGLS